MITEREKVDLVVVDLVMPEMSGPEFCHLLKSERRTQLIPILMTTSVQGTENEVTGIESGADEFLIKPLQPAVARTRIRAMLRNKALTRFTGRGGNDSIRAGAIGGASRQIYRDALREADDV